MSQLSTNKQRYTLIPTPFDSKRTNCYVDGSNIVIETIAEYLTRVTADIRDTFIVTIMLPKDGYSAGTFPIATFSTILADFDFKLYGFVGGLADINFVELDFSTVASFLDLTDTPDSYTGQGNKLVSVKNDESGLEFITASTNSITVVVNQPSHGLSIGYPIRVSGINTYVGAQADSVANAEVVGYVTEVVDIDNFKYVPIGEVTTGVPTVAAGTVLFLSPTVQGGLTSTEPTTVGQVSKPLMVVIESGAKALFINYRGMKITATEEGIIDAENLGSGKGIFAAIDAGVLQLKSLVEGTNVTLSSDGDAITINAAGGTISNSVTFNNTGGASPNTSYNGSAAVTVDYSTIGAAPLSHTHSYAGSASAGGAANSVANNSIIKFDTGSIEGTDLYTYNGSGTKTINIKAGTNISISKASGEITISATGGTSGSLSASSVTVVASGNISSTNVQGAIVELDSEKQPNISLTTTGSSGASTFITNTLNIPNYTLSGLGGQPALSGTGFVKISGTTIRYDNSTYITSAGTAANVSGIVAGANGGTGIANTGKTITLGGNVTTSGAYALTLTLSNTTSVTLPTTGTLSTLAGTETLTNKLYDFSSALGSNNTYSGIIEIGIVGETVAFGDVLYLKFSDGKWWKAKADAYATTPAVRMAMAAISANASGVLLIEGNVRYDSWSLAARNVWLSAATAGAITTTQPSTTGNQIQFIGTAKTSTTMYFKPSSDVGEK